MTDTARNGRVRLSALKTSRALEKEGVWRTWVPGAEFKIARASGDHFQSVLEDEITKWKEENEGQVLGNEALTRLRKRVFSRAVFRDLRGIEDEDGAPFEYSPELIYEWLTDPEMHDLWDWVQQVAHIRDGYLKASEQEELGNS